MSQAAIEAEGVKSALSEVAELRAELEKAQAELKAANAAAAKSKARITALKLKTRH